jgi:hypothetical protein
LGHPITDYELARKDRVSHLSAHLSTVIRRVFALARHHFSIYHPFRSRIKDRNIGGFADSNGATMAIADSSDTGRIPTQRRENCLNFHI